VKKAGTRYEFTADEVTALLRELGSRLERRGVAAAVFVVGGAAIAATQVRDGRLTADIDAVANDTAVLEEVDALTAARNLPLGWFNTSARPWMPPLPVGVLTKPDRPGLRVTYADEGFLFATKLVAQRAKDADDLAALAARLGMQRATADDLVAHIRRYYTDEGTLRFIIGADNVDEEVLYLAEAAARFLARRPRTS